VIVRAVDQGVSVAAGASAEVSWFPHVRRAPIAATGTALKEILYTTGVTPAQSLASGVSARLEFGPEPNDGLRYYTNTAGDWTFTHAASGGIDSVSMTNPGLYLIHARLSFATPGNYNKTLSLVCNSAETNPIGNANEQVDSFDSNAQTVTAVSLFALSATSAPGFNTVTASGLQSSGGGEPSHALDRTAG
jgi:hypothetical protein